MGLLVGLLVAAYPLFPGSSAQPLGVEFDFHRRRGPSGKRCLSFDGGAAYDRGSMERWARIEELFHAVLSRPKEERAAYLLEACPDEESIRQEVEQLLASDEGSAGFLDGSPYSGLLPLDVKPGDVVAEGRYRIVGRVGSGGMGDVYKALDTRLNRFVALKVCRERFTKRFEGEARAVAALNHPHICTLYDVGPNYLVLEFLDGKPWRGPLRPETAVQHAIQITDALHAAHRQGIIHRDIKPENLLLTASGIKIVDFGIAKRTDPVGGEPTGSDTITTEHQIPGTLRYLGPEQLEGRPASERTDIYAFGLVLYEVIAGTPAFQATSSITLMASILKDDPPPISEVQPRVSPALARVIHKCMAKDPETRWQTAADLRDELRWIAQQGNLMAPPAAASRKPVRTAVFAAGLLLLTVALVGFFRDRVDLTTPVVMLMDTSAPSGVYDDETRHQSGTNADDLSNGLSGLPAVFQKETLSVEWNREDQILKRSPALILIHRSAFVHALAFEFSPDPLVKTPQADPATDEELYRRLTRIGRDKMESLLGYLANSNGAMHFVVYSRDWSQQSQQRWLAGVTRRYPQLTGRITPFELIRVEGKASFRVPRNMERIQQLVAERVARR
jgi:serine/threonine protein kinase